MPKVYVCIWNYSLPHKTINSWHLICRMSHSVSLLRKIVGTFYVIPSHLRTQFFQSCVSFVWEESQVACLQKLSTRTSHKTNFLILSFCLIYFYIHWKCSIIPYLNIPKTIIPTVQKCHERRKKNTKITYSLFRENVIWKYAKWFSLNTNDNDYQWV